MSDQPVADALVLFGATGDLARRKLYPALYQLERRGAIDVPVIGVARSDWTDDSFREHAREAVVAAEPEAAPEVIDALMHRLDLIQGDYADPATWSELRDTLDRCGSRNAVFYMAIPPGMFPAVATSLASVGLNERGRIVVEKPFGRDLASARELNATLHAVFPEERIFRIDHYLGKESVEDLLVFRFSNTLLEPVWNRNYVRSVQITMAESIGVEGRGSFYDGVGAVRDILQNHLLQVAALVAMRRSWPRGWRSTRGAGPVCRGSCGAERASPEPPPRWWSSSASRHGCCSTRWPDPPRCATSSGSGWARTTGSPSPCRPRPPARTSTARTWISGSISPLPSASAARPTSACWAMPSPARPAGSPGRTSSSRRGVWCSPCSTIRARCTPTSGVRGALPKPTASSAATPGSNPPDDEVGLRVLSLRLRRSMDGRSLYPTGCPRSQVNSVATANGITRSDMFSPRIVV
jgi:hypothetical protein